MARPASKARDSTGTVDASSCGCLTAARSTAPTTPSPDRTASPGPAPSTSRASNTLTATIGGLPAGTGFQIAITAMTTDGASQLRRLGDVRRGGRQRGHRARPAACHEAPRTGSVMVSGTLNVCPTIDGINANPAEVNVGGTHRPRPSRRTTATPAPAALGYAWTASGPARSPTPTPRARRFTCNAPGTVDRHRDGQRRRSRAACAATHERAGQLHGRGPHARHVRRRRLPQPHDLLRRLDLDAEAGQEGDRQERHAVGPRLVRAGRPRRQRQPQLHAGRRRDARDARLPARLLDRRHGCSARPRPGRTPIRRCSRRASCRAPAPNQNMWRWQSMQEFQYPLIEYLAALKNCRCSSASSRSSPATSTARCRSSPARCRRRSTRAPLPDRARRYTAARQRQRARAVGVLLRSRRHRHQPRQHHRRRHRRQQLGLLGHRAALNAARSELERHRAEADPRRRRRHRHARPRRRPSKRMKWMAQYHPERQLLRARPPRARRAVQPGRQQRLQHRAPAQLQQRRAAASRSASRRSRATAPRTTAANTPSRRNNIGGVQTSTASAARPTAAPASTARRSAACGTRCSAKAATSGSSPAPTGTTAAASAPTTAARRRTSTPASTSATTRWCATAADKLAAADDRRRPAHAATPSRPAASSSTASASWPASDRSTRRGSVGAKRAPSNGAIEQHRDRRRRAAPRWARSWSCRPGSDIVVGDRGARPGGHELLAVHVPEPVAAAGRHQPAAQHAGARPHRPDPRPGHRLQDAGRAGLRGRMAAQHDWLNADGTTPDLDVVPAAAKNTSAGDPHAPSTAAARRPGRRDVVRRRHDVPGHDVPHPGGDGLAVRAPARHEHAGRVPFETDADGNPLADVYTNAQRQRRGCASRCTDGRTAPSSQFDGCPDHLATAIDGCPTQPDRRRPEGGRRTTSRPGRTCGSTATRSTSRSTARRWSRASSRAALRVRSPAAPRGNARRRFRYAVGHMLPHSPTSIARRLVRTPRSSAASRRRPGWLREPLLHFVVARRRCCSRVDHVLVGRADDPRTIVVGAEVDQRGASRSSRRRAAASPNADELYALRRVWLDNEVLYREGLALQVDKGDPAIRERVIFKALSVVDATSSCRRSTTRCCATWFEQPSRQVRRAGALRLPGGGARPATAPRRPCARSSKALNARHAGRRARPGCACSRAGRTPTSSRATAPSSPRRSKRRRPGEWQRAADARRLARDAARRDHAAEARASSRPCAASCCRTGPTPPLAEQRTAAVRALAKKYKVKYEAPARTSLE